MKKSVTGYSFPNFASALRLFRLRNREKGSLSPILVQGCYYASAGVWPLVSIDTFQAVTGPKNDLWLVRTVGMLVTVIGIVLLMAWWRRSVALEIAVLATGSAAALAAIDVYYVARRLLSPIYLADALAETALIVWWAVRLTREMRSEE